MIKAMDKERRSGFDLRAIVVFMIPLLVEKGFSCPTSIPAYFFHPILPILIRPFPRL